jgi:hypothetical protein
MGSNQLETNSTSKSVIRIRIEKWDKQSYIRVFHYLGHGMTKIWTCTEKEWLEGIHEWD